MKISHSTPAYVSSRIRAIFKKQGWPLHKMSGRYSPFCNTQTGTEGYSARKVGCSKTVAIHYTGGYVSGRPLPISSETMTEKKTAAIALLRSLGYRVADNGFINCDHYDDRD